MPFSLHAGAQAAFNARADALLASVASRVEAAQPTENDLLEFNGIPVPVSVMWESLRDDDIRVAVIFPIQGKTVRVDGDDFLSLVHLAEGLQGRRELSDAVSVEAALDVLVDWLGERILSETDATFVHFLLDWLERHVTERTIVFPIFHLRFDATLSVNGVKIRQLQASEVDEWYAHLLGDSEWRERLEGERNQWRERIGGWAAAFVLVNAEPKHALEVAFRKAVEVLAILRSFSSAMLIPSRRSRCTIYGMEHVERRTAFSLDLNRPGFTGGSVT
ncbi:MAG: hypothetical protein WKG32_21555 [Gemmatimonadaceae bacterium]